MLAKLIVGSDTKFLIEEAVAAGMGKSVSLINNPDVFLIPELSEEVSSIGVAETKKLAKWLQILPLQADTKLAIIQSAELLTVEAQNSLLKLLEEPPEYAQLVLISKNEEAFLPTVLSRLVVVKADFPIESSSNLESETKNLRKLLSFKPSNRLIYTDKLAKNREVGLNKVDLWIKIGHELLLKKSAGSSKEVTYWKNFIQILVQARKFLQSNTHVQLTFDWLLLRIPRLES